MSCWQVDDSARPAPSPRRTPATTGQSATKASTSATNCDHAGSCSRRMWLSLSSGTNRASGISAANSSPCSTGHPMVVGGVEHEGRRLDAWGEVGDVDVGRHRHQAEGVLGRRRAPLQLHERRPLLDRALGHELRREHAPERRVLPCPAGAQQLEHHLGVPQLGFGARPLGAPEGKGAVEDEVAHPLRVPGGVRGGHRATLADAEQREPIEARRRPRPPRGRSPSSRTTRRPGPSPTGRTPRWS